MDHIRPDLHNTERDGPLFPISTAARLRGLTARRLRRAIRAGQLEAFSIGGWLRVRLDDVDAWLARQRYVPGEGRSQQADG